MPPALVDRLPPIWQLPSAPRLSGNSRSTSAAASCSCARMHPASTVIVKLTGSIARIRFMRPSATTMLSPSSEGTPPPTRPVFPPCGTIGSLDLAQIRTTSATSAVDAGRHNEAGRAAPQAPRFRQIGFLFGRIGDPSSGTNCSLDPLERSRDFHDLPFVLKLFLYLIFPRG